MAGWRCPEGDASSRWLNDIRNDLISAPTTIAAILTVQAVARAIRWLNWQG
jgi:hypothetical protein